MEERADLIDSIRNHNLAIFTWHAKCTMLTGLPGPAYTVPPPRRMGGRVLYLDLDGCLHPDAVFEKGSGPFIFGYPDHSLFEHARLLEDALAPYPRVRIVLSTSWVRRYRGSIRRVSRGLTPALRERVVGATFHSRMDLSVFDDAPRGFQVWSDVLRRKPETWLALDDDVENWPRWCEDRLVRTDPIFGISAPEALAQLKEKLYEMDGRRCSDRTLPRAYELY
ncbi:hypothetical protein B0G81_3869 [Paraburkholderia sp. BL6665CI2N2]|nr:hypothetical protein B0G81_3869 [Paraburkholderia sp. BL6665CI2N2]